MAHVDPADRAYIEGLGLRADRTANLLLVLGVIGHDTDLAGSFRRPLRDAGGDTARWVAVHGITWRTAHRCIEQLRDHKLIDAGVCFTNPSGPRPRRSWRPATRPALVRRPRPEAPRCETRQACGCGSGWRRWHGGRLDARCRRCWRSAGLRAHRERTVPVSLAPKCHTEEQGSSLTRSSRPVTARGPTRRQQHRKSHRGPPLRRRAPRSSPCRPGALDDWLTEHHCHNPQCDHRVPSRPQGDGVNRWCRCCWRRGRDAVPSLTPAERYTREGMPQELIDFLVGDGPEPSAQDLTRIEAEQRAGRRRLDELLATRPIIQRVPPESDDDLKRRALQAAARARRATAPRGRPGPGGGPAAAAGDGDPRRGALARAVRTARGDPAKYGRLTGTAARQWGMMPRRGRLPGEPDSPPSPGIGPRPPRRSRPRSPERSAGDAADPGPDGEDRPGG